MGMAMSICETTSGGVKMAAMIKITRMAYFLFLVKKSMEIMPSFTRKTRTSGSSKIRPKTSRNSEAKL